MKNITDFRNEWNLRLSGKVPMDLRVNMGAGSSNLQLAGLSLTGLDVKLGAGTYTVDLSGDWARNLDVTINTGAANITVRLPRDVGARVKVEPGPHTIEATGLTQDGDVYTNAAYGVSGVTMRVDLKAGIGQINLEVDEHTQAKAELQDLLDQQVKEQGILGMVMAVRLADGTVIWDTSGYTSPSGKERWSANSAETASQSVRSVPSPISSQNISTSPGR